MRKFDSEQLFDRLQRADGHVELKYDAVGRCLTPFALTESVRPAADVEKRMLHLCPLLLHVNFKVD